MQKVSKSPPILIILVSLTVGLIIAAIALELLPEDQAKVYVIPTLVAAAFAGIAQLFSYKRY